MGTVARVPDSSGGGTPAPEGNHLAVCVGVIDLGTQYSKFYDTWKPKVMIQWELSDELMGDGRPFVISRRFTLSLHENAGLRKILNSWRGRPFTPEEAAGFDIAKVLGKPGMVNVVHEPKEGGGGVFAKYVRHARRPEIQVSFEDAARTTSGQVSDVVRYVEQSNPKLINKLLTALSRLTRRRQRC